MKLCLYCKMPLLHEQARAFFSTHSCSSYHMHLSASGCIFQFTIKSLSNVPYANEYRTKKVLSLCLRKLPLFRAIVINFLE